MLRPLLLMVLPPLLLGACTAIYISGNGNEVDFEDRKAVEFTPTIEKKDEDNEPTE